MDYAAPPPLTRNWSTGEIYEVGNLKFSSGIAGHTPGHVCLGRGITEKKFLSANCLFLGSIGRTDLPGGSYEQLIESIETNISSLG
jgi:glyoxylase-like metal-dependent hydrolase (beta-lactamase superfamily II)